MRRFDLLRALVVRQCGLFRRCLSTQAAATPTDPKKKFAFATICARYGKALHPDLRPAPLSISRYWDYISFYHYVTPEQRKALEANDNEALLAAFEELWKVMLAANVRGRIYVAAEGLNGQMIVPAGKAKELQKKVNAIPGGWYNSVQFNVSEQFDAENQVLPFSTLHIRKRPHLVADGLPDEEDEKLDLRLHDEATISPEEWHNALPTEEEVRSGKVAVLDIRNWYEWEVGRFEHAAPIPVERFKDTFPYLEELFGLNGKGGEEKKRPERVMLYCTGGIRCVKVAPWLKQRGIENVQVLRGGIVAYAKWLADQQKKAEKAAKRSAEGTTATASTSSSSSSISAVPGMLVRSRFLGKNYVFDKRMAFGNEAVRITSDVLSKCHLCGTAADTHRNCANVRCNVLFIQCPSCEARLHGCCSEACKEEVLAERAGQPVPRRAAPTRYRLLRTFDQIIKSNEWGRPLTQTQQRAFSTDARVSTHC